MLSSPVICFEFNKKNEMIVNRIESAGAVRSYSSIEIEISLINEGIKAIPEAKRWC